MNHIENTIFTFDRIKEMFDPEDDSNRNINLLFLMVGELLSYSVAMLMILSAFIGIGAAGIIFKLLLVDLISIFLPITAAGIISDTFLIVLTTQAVVQGSFMLILQSMNQLVSIASSDIRSIVCLANQGANRLLYEAGHYFKQVGHLFQNGLDLTQLSEESDNTDHHTMGISASTS